MRMSDRIFLGVAAALVFVVVGLVQADEVPGPVLVLLYLPFLGLFAAVSIVGFLSGAAALAMLFYRVGRWAIERDEERHDLG